MNKIIVFIEITILLLVSVFYVIPHWEIKGLNFSDLFVLELFYLIGNDIYKQLKEKI